MGFFKKLFGLEKEEPKPVITENPEIINKENNTIQEQQVSEEKPIEKVRESLDKLCELCKKPIGLDHYTKKGGLFIHKSCYKEKLKKLKAQGKIY